MGIGKTLEQMNMENYQGGVNYALDLMELEPNESPNSMNVVFKDGKIYKREGYATWFSLGSARVNAIRDYGVSAFERFLVAHVGETVYRIRNLSTPAVVLREAAPNVKSTFTEVKQFLIHTYDNYTAPFYWDGDTGTMQIISASAPNFKYATEFQGYLLGANVESANLRVYYEDTNTMIGGDYANYFTLPGSKDDEIQSFFKINGRQYIGTKNAVFRISFIGGVAVFEYKEVVSDVGVVPGSVKVVVTPEFGQVAMFLGQDRNLYLFDGAFVRKISRKYFKPNYTTPFALQYIDRNNFDNSFAVYDSLEDTYRLFVTPKGQDENYYAVNVDLETFAYYPFDNMSFTAGAVVKDLIGQEYIVTGDANGNLYKMFNGAVNDNGEPIVEYYESPLLNKSPISVSKNYFANLVFKPVASYNVRVYGKSDNTTSWSKISDVPMYNQRDRFLGLNTVLGETAALGSVQELVSHQVRVPTTGNTSRIKVATPYDDEDYVCSYITGTVSGTGGGVSITGTGTAWESYMTAANDYKIWIDSGNHKNEVYDFTFVSASSGTVSTMAAGDFTDAEYMIYRKNCAICSKGWELVQTDMVYENTSVGKGRRSR